MPPWPISQMRKRRLRQVPELAGVLIVYKAPPPNPDPEASDKGLLTPEPVLFPPDHVLPASSVS